jgi:hypothetical protein
MLILCGTSCVDATSGRSGGAVADTGVAVVEGDAACSGCDIIADTLAILGSPTDPASIRSDAPVAGCMVGIPERGHYIVSGLVGGGQLIEYADSADVLTTRVIGRSGSGPNEFGANLRLIAEPDTLWVVDITNGRMAVTDRAGAFVRSFPLPVRVHSIARLASGTFLIHSRPLTNEDPGPLFRILDERGEQISAFGSPSPSLGEKDQWVVSARPNGGFLAGSMWEYRIYRGAMPEQLDPYLVRHVDWFPRGNTWNEDILVTDAPPPLVTHVFEDASGLVWTFVTLADEGWSSDIPDPGSAQWFRESFDTVVEVIDPSERVVLATRRFDDWLSPVCGSENMFSVVPIPSGDNRAVLFSLSLRAPP